MLYDDLHRQYGAHIAKRVQRELSPSEFTKIKIEELASYLEMRAEAAHKEYKIQLNNPLESGINRSQAINVLCRRWREAEDMAYLVVVADGVCTNLTKLKA